MLIVMMTTQDLTMRVMIRGEGLLCPFAYYLLFNMLLLNCITSLFLFTTFFNMLKSLSFLNAGD